MVANSKIIVTGHPYAFPHYLRVFSYVDLADFIFVLPKIWRSKLTFRPTGLPGTHWYGLWPIAFGRRSLLGGTLKGWLPGVVWLLPYLRAKFGARILYSCSEPNLLTTLFNGLLAKLFGLKYVFFTWQNLAPEKYTHGFKLKLLSWLIGLNVKLADGVICGNQGAETIIRRFSERIAILRSPLSGVDTAKFNPEVSSNWREKLQLTDQKVILFYGALDKRKGLTVLLKALARVPDPQVRLIIVGSGPEKSALTDQVSVLNLVARVIFIDWMSHEELPGLICAADVFVYPSVPTGGWEEQFGYGMAEAGASGLPVIATHIGSIAEVVVPNQTGILVEPNEAGELAEALEKLLNNKEERKLLGTNARRYISENYSHKKVAEKISSFLNSF